MDTCRNCEVDLPLKIRFCPFCGAKDPVASKTVAVAPLAVETGRVEPARDASSAGHPPPVAVDFTKIVVAPVPQPLAQERTTTNATTNPAVAADSSQSTGAKSASIGRWALLAVAGLAAAAWFARPMFGPSDPCQSSSVASELDQARTALGARDHRNALSKSTLALTTCAQGQRADELRRIQTEAVNLIVAEGRRCLKSMDVACLERVGGDLTLVTQHAAAKAFNADLERDIGTRTNRDLEETRRCIVTGNIECADQRIKLPLALRRNDTPVQALQDQLEKARAAVLAAKSCTTATTPECVAEALEGLRQASPQSALIKGLERRLPPVAQATEPMPSEGGPKTVATPPTAAAPVAAPNTADSQSAATPSLPPSIPVPEVRTGDRWVLQTTDHNNPQWSNSTERIVTEVNNSNLTMISRNTRSNYTRTLTFTREWNLESERDPTGKGSTYSPAMRYLSFPLEKGKTWRAEVRKQRSDGGAEQVYTLSAEVQGVERVQVRAGAFEAVKVVLQVETRENGVLLSQATDVSWYAPVAKRSVKTEENSHDLQKQLRSTRTIELVEYSVSR